MVVLSSACFGRLLCKVFCLNLELLFEDLLCASVLRAHVCEAAAVNLI